MNLIIKHLRIFLICTVVVLSACHDDSNIAERPYLFSGATEEISFSDRLPVISELPLKNIKEPIAYRFWFYCHYLYKVISITQDKTGKVFAHYCTWHGGVESVHDFKSWKRELKEEEAEQFFELIKSSNFWKTNESVTLPMKNLSTGGARYNIEAKNNTDFKIAMCKREYEPDYKSVYEDLSKKVFILMGEPTPDLPR